MGMDFLMAVKKLSEQCPPRTLNLGKLGRAARLQEKDPVDHTWNKSFRLDLLSLHSLLSILVRAFALRYSLHFLLLSLSTRDFNMVLASSALVSESGIF